MVLVGLIFFFFPISDLNCPSSVSLVYEPVSILCLATLLRDIQQQTQQDTNRLSSLTFVEWAMFHHVYALHICDVSEIYKGDVNGNRAYAINYPLKRKNVCRLGQKAFFFLIFPLIKTLAALKRANGTEKSIRGTSPMTTRKRINGNRSCTDRYPK